MPVSQMKLERSIERAFVEWCNSENVTTVKMDPTGRRGVPDRVVILPDGHVLFIEFKVPGKYPSPHQVQWRDSLINLGHSYHVATSADQAAGIVITRLSEISHQRNLGSS